MSWDGRRSPRCSPRDSPKIGNDGPGRACGSGHGCKSAARVALSSRSVHPLSDLAYLSRYAFLTANGTITICAVWTESTPSPRRAPRTGPGPRNAARGTPIPGKSCRQSEGGVAQDSLQALLRHRRELRALRYLPRCHHRHRRKPRPRLRPHRNRDLLRPGHSRCGKHCVVPPREPRSQPERLRALTTAVATSSFLPKCATAASPGASTPDEVEGARRGRATILRSVAL